MAAAAEPAPPRNSFMPRRFPIFQLPNAPLSAALASGAVARAVDGRAARGAAAVSGVSLLVWAYLELTDGANWFRRLLGVGGAVSAISSLRKLLGEPSAA